jgi:BirA family transcriptional regulator, biotin operon repressor / biotin---[acetyl-CoA-carboxylase] ligase
VSAPPGRAPLADAGSAFPPALGRPRVHLRRTDSTNERARALAVAGAPHGTLVTADEQTAGRGRQGRRWSAPPRSSLLMSVLLRSPPPLLPLMAALAVCDTIGTSVPEGEQALIKWPNDIVLAREQPGGSQSGARPPLAKLAGILVEGRPQEGWMVLGIGINVAVRLDELPPELRTPKPAGAGAPVSGLPAATLGLAPDRIEPTLDRLLGALAGRLAEPARTTLGSWRACDVLRGREVAWAQGRGRAQGIDGTGRLVVALASGGQTEIGAGEVHLREPG